jgi:hypothetical protein
MVNSQVCSHAILKAWLAWDTRCLGWCKKRCRWQKHNRIGQGRGCGSCGLELEARNGSLSSVGAERVFASRRESARSTPPVEPEVRSLRAQTRDLRRLCVRSDDAVRQLRGTQRFCPPPAAASAVLVEHLCPSPSASWSRDNKRNKSRASDASEIDSARSHDPDNHAEPNRLSEAAVASIPGGVRRLWVSTSS